MKEWMGRREPLVGSSLVNILRLLIQNKFRVYPKYWYRLILTIIISIWLIPIRTIEKIKYQRKIKKTTIISDPIFIIGHWRTGTTFLHYLMAYDQSKGFVTNMDTFGVNFSLSAGRLVKKLTDFTMPKKRPMDDVNFSKELPGEDEYALTMINKRSFYHSFIFPRKLAHYSKYLTFKECSKGEIEKWKKEYHYFLQKITYKHQGKQLILKNPPNTSRIKILKELYPKAKFIFLHRNPYEIYASTKLLFEKVLPNFSLQKWDIKKIEEQFIKNFSEMHTSYCQNKKLLRKNELIELSYEELLAYPLKSLEQIYNTLELKGFEENKNNFEGFIAEQKNYRANIHEIDSKIIDVVNENWKKYLEKYNYIIR